ncbi:hypothetical protein GEMRC1_004787 [Eukaryota sp. GEM-RC1]
MSSVVVLKIGSFECGISGRHANLEEWFSMRSIVLPAEHPNGRPLFGEAALGKENNIRPITERSLNKEYFISLLQEILRRSKVKDLTNQCVITNDVEIPSQKSQEELAECLFSNFEVKSLLIVPQQFASGFAFFKTNHAQFPPYQHLYRTLCDNYFMRQLRSTKQTVFF